MKAIALTFMIFVFSIGCASYRSKLNRVSVGMTKPQVLEVMGSPHSTKAIRGEETMVYALQDGWKVEDYWIILKDGKVTSYGEAGDFGTAAPPTQKMIIEHSGKDNASGK